MKVKKESEKAVLKTQHPKNEDHGTPSHHFMANWWGNNGNIDRLYFLGLQNHCIFLGNPTVPLNISQLSVKIGKSEKNYRF